VSWPDLDEVLADHTPCWPLLAVRLQGLRFRWTMGPSQETIPLRYNQTPYRWVALPDLEVVLAVHTLCWSMARHVRRFDFRLYLERGSDDLPLPHVQGATEPFHQITRVGPAAIFGL